KGMQVHADLPSSLHAAALEAVIGAIYLDGGFDAVRDFLLPRVLPIIEKAERSGHQQNFKSVLQHVAQDRFSVMPTYIMLDEKGPDHAKCFEVCVQIGADRYESCWGQSKKQAEQMAALKALEALGVTSCGDDGEILIVNGDAEAASVEAEPEEAEAAAD
ncbi:MAG: putative dsRNA-binding protein, partial [Planctomycetota bacterium]|nr:putative dsRNA-binding protein [Planctomycetota bacterium]